MFFYTDDRFASDICQLRMKPDDFNLIKVIGRGAFGEVQLVSSSIFINIFRNTKDFDNLVIYKCIFYLSYHFTCLVLF